MSNNTAYKETKWRNTYVDHCEVSYMRYMCPECRAIRRVALYELEDICECQHCGYQWRRNR